MTSTLHYLPRGTPSLQGTLPRLNLCDLQPFNQKDFQAPVPVALYPNIQEASGCGSTAAVFIGQLRCRLFR